MDARGAGISLLAHAHRIAGLALASCAERGTAPSLRMRPL